MKERPILFRGDLVRAILEGRKTMTRRPFRTKTPEGWKPTVGLYHPTIIVKGEEQPGEQVYGAADEDFGCPSPYGQPDDRLWVRETARLRSVGPSDRQIDLAYAATDSVSTAFYPLSSLPFTFTRWTPSIHMPRWASRILLEIVSVRVERVKDISRSDIRREGIPDHVGVRDGVERDTFRDLWNATYPGHWDRNEPVWVYEFKRITP